MRSREREERERASSPRTSFFASVHDCALSAPARAKRRLDRHLPCKVELGWRGDGKAALA